MITTSRTNFVKIVKNKCKVCLVVKAHNHTMIHIRCVCAGVGVGGGGGGEGGNLRTARTYNVSVW